MSSSSKKAADFTKEAITRMSMGGTVTKDNPVRRIVIHQPKVENKNGHAILTSQIDLGEVQKEVTFSTESEYGQYLCYERSDAYLIGMLSIAMRERCDIFCEAPVTKELLHQLRTELIPSLCLYDKALYAPHIEAQTRDEELPCAGKIGTGCSCGIDSMYAIQDLEKSPDYQLDYITLNNVGAFETSIESNFTKRRQESIENALAFANAYNYKIIITDSNFAEAFPQCHLYTHLYSSAFCIYALRKLWKRYYYASTGCDLQNYYSLTNNHMYDAAKYSLIALPAFSIPSLRICDHGMSVSRFEKTKALVDYLPAQRYLNVCLHQGKGGCGACTKCKRTLWDLEALGKLENFGSIFNLTAYKAHHARNLTRLYVAHRMHEVMTKESFLALRGQITIWMRIYGEFWIMLKKTRIGRIIIQKITSIRGAK